MNLRHRLYLDWLALICSYTYRWAHKPLCSRFREDVLRIGGIHLCRSCLMIWVGAAMAAAMAVALWAAGVAGHVLGGATCLCIGCAVIALAMFPSRLYKSLPRFVRDLQRLLSGLAAGLAVVVILLGAWPVGVIVLVVLFTARMLYLRGRGVRKLRACDGCPELSDSKVCSGFAYQAELARRFEIRAADYLESKGIGQPRIKI